MKTKQGVASGADRQDEARREQRVRNLRAFQAKCDAMLNVLEFISEFECMKVRSAAHEKSMTELNALIADARSKLKADGDRCMQG